MLVLITWGTLRPNWCLVGGAHSLLILVAYGVEGFVYCTGVNKQGARGIIDLHDGPLGMLQSNSAVQTYMQKTPKRLIAQEIEHSHFLFFLNNL